MLSINKLQNLVYLMLNKKLHYITICFTIISIIIYTSCKNVSEKEEMDVTRNYRDIDTSTVLIKYNNTLFTLPSPYQASYAIKKSNIDFRKSILNPPDNVSNYTTNFQKALNIGIYGTDLGYLNIYDQLPDVISYFTVIKKSFFSLSSKLVSPNHFSQ